MLNTRAESSPNSVRRRWVSTNGTRRDFYRTPLQAQVWNFFCFAVRRRIDNPQDRRFSDGGTVPDSRVLQIAHRPGTRASTRSGLPEPD
jgi:hypothetical protein